ncbi:acyltransferase [Mesorhizobium sp. 1M-11]|uniref:acyltransferase family protein n=1 Tax=Mesorhizobium sp. 1M-11 TaxID=1529006 RepID=UPI0006C76EED|nr:acyltransferase [Mesorhizobium sp. 1M-11]
MPALKVQGWLVQHEIVRYDLARGVAALIVFAAHLSQAFLYPLVPPNSWLEFIGGIAARGAVLAFFVLSGLLVTGSIIANIRRNGAFDPADYLISRAARIYPPFLFAFVVMVGLAAFVHFFGFPGGAGPLGQLRPDGLVYAPQELWKSLLLHSGLTAMNGPLWTLYIEVKLYLLAMGVALVFFGKSAMSRIVGGCVCAFVALFWAKVDIGFWFFASMWAFGASINLRSTALMAVSGAILLLAGVFVFAPFNPGNSFDATRFAVGIQALFCLVFAVGYLLPKYAERRWPRPLMASAGYSYTLYVLHFPLIELGLSLSIAAGLTSRRGAVLSLFMTAIVALGIAMATAPWLENSKRFKEILSRRLLTRHA